MNAVLKYPGGKWRIADWIINHFPSHNVYLEPFFGSGAVFFNKAPARIETINDINGEIVNLFRVCRDQGEKLAKMIKLTPFSRQEYVECYKKSTNEIEQARRTLVRYWQSFGTSNSSKNSWKNSQTSNSPNNPMQFCLLSSVILGIIERLKGTQIENYDAIELIKRYNSDDVLIYCDPPYLLSLRKKAMYKDEMTDAMHLELIETLKSSKAKICLSAYDNELYNDMLKGWITDEKKTIAQMGKQRREKIYMNYDPPWLLF